MYRKPTDTSKILKVRSCAPLQHIRNRVQGTVQRRFHCTSICNEFDDVPKTNKNIWLKKQYPERWTAKTSNEFLETFVLKNKHASETKK